MLLSTAELAAGTRSCTFPKSPGEQVQHQAQSVLEEQTARNLPRGINPGIPNEEQGPTRSDLITQKAHSTVRKLAQPFSMQCSAPARKIIGQEIIVDWIHHYSFTICYLQVSVFHSSYCFSALHPILTDQKLKKKKSSDFDQFTFNFQGRFLS